VSFKVFQVSSRGLLRCDAT